MVQATDYLIVGAGASGLAFADSLLTESPEATITLIDRRDEVGGHWCDTYSFVRLHTPSAYYGVGSLPLGQDRIQESGRNAGFYEQATGSEVHAYFQKVLHERLLPSGRVTFLPRHEYLEHKDGLAQLRDLRPDNLREIPVHRRIVDARYQQSAVPATHKPSFTVHPDAAFIPIGQLPAQADDYRRYIVIGGGKTSVDACLWLLDAGIDPDQIRWIRPREAWFANRAQLQPLDQVGVLMKGSADEAEACAHASDVTDLFHRLEAVGRYMRIDEQTEPTMYRVTMLSRRELLDLRQITGDIRRGHVRAIEPTHIRFDDGELTVRDDELLIDCSAYGIAPSPAVPIFAEHKITLQQIRHASPTFNAAFIAVLETHRDNDDDRNWLAEPNPPASRPADILMMLVRTWISADRWRHEPDLRTWISNSRLNLARGVGKKMENPQIRSALERYVVYVPQAIENLRRLANA